MSELQYHLGSLWAVPMLGPPTPPPSFGFRSSGVGGGVRFFPSSPRAISAGNPQAPPCEILHRTFHPAGNSAEAQLMVDSGLGTSFKAGWCSGAQETWVKFRPHPK